MFSPLASGVIAVQGGDFIMGSDAHYPEERPQRPMQVKSFRLDSTLVRNIDFARFVKQTDYETVAQRKGFSHVFHMTEGPVNLNNPDAWWKAVQGACWSNPQPGLALPADFDLRPVVHIALEDAKAYAAWLGGRLPTEAEWEYAARGGVLNASGNSQFAWGDEFAPQGQRMAQVWQGAFPWYSAAGSSPSPSAVAAYPANPLGLFDMIGNVWEWTSSPFDSTRTCCSCSPQLDAENRFCLKGGSYLCAAEYCLRYRPPARIGLAGGSTTGHAGFRCAYDMTP